MLTAPCATPMPIAPTPEPANASPQSAMIDDYLDLYRALVSANLSRLMRSGPFSIKWGRAASAVPDSVPALTYSPRHPPWLSGLSSLTETRKVGGIKIMAQVKITVRPNGPYRVEAAEGSVELVDVNGTQYDLTGKPAFSLCRCGGSVNKPFL